MTHKKLRIFFFGTPEIAVPSLTQLTHDEHVEIVGVGVFPDKKVGRKQILTPCPVKREAQKLRLPIYEIPGKKELEKICQNVDFDLGIVIAFGMIFPQKLLTENPFVNVHFSLLPEWRGASPVQAAILNGQHETGITWQRMVYALDAGNILWQKTYPISGMNTAEVWSDFAEKTAENFPEFIEKYLGKNYQETPQIDENATFCGKFTKEDGKIDFSKDSAETILRKFLAFTPWPGIYVETQHGILKIKALSGTAQKNSWEISCADGNSLWIERAQLAGKKEMPITDLLNGYPDLFTP